MARKPRKVLTNQESRELETQRIGNVADVYLQRALDTMERDTGRRLRTRRTEFEVFLTDLPTPVVSGSSVYVGHRVFFKFTGELAFVPLELVQTICSDQTASDDKKPPGQRRSKKKIAVRRRS